MPPAGSPPFAYRPAFEAVGWRPVSREEHEEARLLFLRRTQCPRSGPRKPYLSA
jgi:hypothetical protein